MEEVRTNVFEKILHVMESVQYLNKDGFVETTKGKGYKALTDEKVVMAIRPALLKERLVILPVAMAQNRTDEQVEGYDGKIKVNRITSVDVQYRIYNVDDPNDYVDVVSCGTGVDTQDKGIGKAMTYSRKYMLLNTFLIPSGEDTDAISSDRYTEQLMGRSEEAAETPSRMDTLRKQILDLADAKGIRRSAVTDASYNGKTWDELTVADLITVKLGIVKR